MAEFFNGFEAGTSSSSGFSQSGTVAPNTTATPRTGGFCGRVNPTTTAVGQYTPTLTNGSASITFTPSIATRFAFRANTLPASNDEEIYSGNGMAIRISSAGILKGYDNGNGLKATGTNPLSTGQWYVIEVFISSGNSVKARFYLDGALPGSDELSYSGITASSGSLHFGKNTNRNGNTISFDYDDIHVKDGISNYYGDGKILPVRGNSTTPTYNAFVKTAGQRIDQVWNDVPWSATNNASSATNADTKQTIKHDPTGISASAIINSAQTVMVGNRGLSGALVFEELHIVGGVDITSALAFGASDSFTYNQWASVPTLANLDSSEVGIFRHGGVSGTVTVEDCWLEVDYNPYNPAQPGQSSIPPPILTRNRYNQLTDNKLVSLRSLRQSRSTLAPAPPPPIATTLSAFPPILDRLRHIPQLPQRVANNRPWRFEALGATLPSPIPYLPPILARIRKELPKFILIPNTRPNKFIPIVVLPKPLPYLPPILVRSKYSFPRPVTPTKPLIKRSIAAIYPSTGAVFDALVREAIASGAGSATLEVDTVVRGAVVTGVPSLIFAQVVRETLGSIPPFTGPIPVFPALPQGFPIKVDIVMDTTIGTTKSLREVRMAQQQFPIWDIELKFEELRDQTQNVVPFAPMAGYLDYENLVQLWLQMYGQTNLFAFDCPWDDSRLDQGIGTGDGSTYIFTIVRTWGSGSFATTAPVGLVNTITNVKINGVAVTTQHYLIQRNKIYFINLLTNLPEPPANGAIVTMTFSYYYLCRFVADEQEFDEFSQSRYQVPSLKFRAVVWP